MNEALIVSNVLLWLAVVALCAVVLALTRQIGVLHERITPVGALVTQQALRVGEAVPDVDLTTIDGDPLHVGGETPAATSTLLFFLSPTCPVCKTLLPIVLRVSRQESPPLRVVLASDGDPAEHRRFIGEHKLAALPYVLSSTLGITYQVAKLPYAALIDASGILRAQGLVNTREHLESLLEAERLGVASIQEYIRRESDEQLETIPTGGNA